MAEWTTVVRWLRWRLTACIAYNVGVLPTRWDHLATGPLEARTVGRGLPRRIGRPAGEIAAAVATGCAAFMSARLFGLHIYLAGPCLLLWLLYAIRRERQDRSVLAQWGLRVDNLQLAALRSLPVLLGGTALMLFYRLMRGWQVPPRSFFAILLLYPIWGIVQQLFVQGITAGNLRRLGVTPRVIVPIVAVMFGMLHAPDWPLAGLCAAAGAVWTTLYLWTPNVIPLGLAHGWLGTLAYYWVLARDPVATLFSGAP